MTADFESSVLTVLASLVPGDVVSYGEVAAAAGYPGAARAVGTVLRRAEGVPWWRVVRADGRLVPHLAVEQARRLRGEGVEVKAGRVARR